MREELSRTELLIGNDSLIRLNNAKVAVFGIGGVGGYAVEALVLRRHWFICTYR